MFGDFGGSLQHPIVVFVFDHEEKLYLFHINLLKSFCAYRLLLVKFSLILSKFFVFYVRAEAI